MQTPVQVTFRSIAHADALDLHIHQRADKLERRFDRIVSCHVVVELEGHHHSTGELFRITVKLGLPGHEILVSHAGSEKGVLESAAQTADGAFDEVERQLGDWVRRQRDDRHRGDQVN